MSYPSVSVGTLVIDVLFTVFNLELDVKRCVPIILPNPFCFCSMYVQEAFLFAFSEFSCLPAAECNVEPNYLD